MHFLLIFLFLLCNRAYASENYLNLPKPQNGVVIYFKNPEVEFKRNEVISNVLVVENQRETKISFYIDLSVPSQWLPTTNVTKLYSVEPGGVLYIPIRIIPRAKYFGGIKYIFSVFLYQEDNQVIGYTSFYAQTTKRIEWDLYVEKTRYYLLNNETDIYFKVGLFNKGEDVQDINLFCMPSVEYILTDSLTKRNIADKPLFVQLGIMRDTIFTLHFQETKIHKRNERVVDLDSYNPHIKLENRRYSVFLQSVSPNPTENRKFRKGRKIEVIRLSNELTVTQRTNNTLPILMELNAYNIFGIQPIMNLHLRGATNISKNTVFQYYTQMYFYNYIFTTDPLRNSIINFSIINPKYSIIFGNIPSRLNNLVSGRNARGVRAYYFITKNQTISAAYSQGTRLFANPDFNSIEASYFFKSKPVSFSLEAGQGRNFLQKSTSTLILSQVSTALIPYHSIGVSVGWQEIKNPSINLSSSRLLYGAQLNGRYFDSRLTTFLRYNHYPSFANYYSSRSLASFDAFYKLKNKDHSFALRSEYDNYKLNPTQDYFDYRFNNFLKYHVRTRLGSFTPQLFYQYLYIQRYYMHSRGVAISYSNAKLEKNLFYTLNTRLGYNYAPAISKENYFFLQTNSILKYRVWSFMGIYTLGNMMLSPTYYRYLMVRNPQSIIISIRHQYEPPPILRGFIFQNGLSFNYSTLTGKNINYNPEVFYFSKSGWRFRVYADMAFYKKNLSQFYYMERRPEDADIVFPWHSSFQMGAGIRKEFNIPLPGKKKYCNVDFIVYYDVNGNGERDRDEMVIENVVININGWEAITSKKGTCSFKNVPVGTYVWSVFAIQDLEGWFPFIPDSISLFKNETIEVPFRRGVKIIGTVTVQWDRYSAFQGYKIDVSRMKVIAISNNNKTFTAVTDKNGNFSFYVPHGHYIVSLDESLIGNRFTLLQNNIEVIADDKYDNLFVGFYIVEKRRKLKVRTATGEVKEKTGDEDLQKPVEGEDKKVRIFQPGGDNQQQRREGQGTIQPAQPQRTRQENQGQLNQNNQQTQPLQPVAPPAIQQAQTQRPVQPTTPGRARITGVTPPQTYYIIAGSFSSITNAEKVADQFISMGYKDIEFHASEFGTIRVSIMKFNNPEDAYREIQNQRVLLNDESLWILAK